MTAATRSAVSAGGALARERLAAYVRYAELLAGQEKALADGDLERFEALAAEAAEVQESMREAGDDPAVFDAPTRRGACLGPGGREESGSRTGPAAPLESNPWTTC